MMSKKRQKTIITSIVGGLVAILVVVGLVINY